MAADKEAISLSRVHSYYSKCKLALFEFYEIFVYSVLEHNTCLASTESVDNLFHTLMYVHRNEAHFTYIYV